MSKIKYMGTADVVRLEKGENFSGRLAEPLAKEVEWDGANGHIVDSEEAGLSAEAVELLLEDTDRFKDVSDLKRIPASLNEQTFRGMKASTEAPNLVSPDGEAQVGGGSLADAGGGSTAGTSTSGGAAPVGGSTAKSGRGGSTS